MATPAPVLTLVPRRSLFAHIAEVESLADTVDALDRANELTAEAAEQLQAALCLAVAGTKQKIDRVTSTLAAFESGASAAKLEAARLTARAARFERNHERLSLFVLAALEASKLDALDGETSGISRRKNPPKVVIDSEAEIPVDFLYWPDEPPPPDAQPDKKKIAASLKLDPASVPGARIGPTTYRLVRT